MRRRSQNGDWTRVINERAVSRQPKNSSKCHFGAVKSIVMNALTAAPQCTELVPQQLQVFVDLIRYRTSRGSTAVFRVNGQLASPEPQKQVSSGASRIVHPVRRVGQGD